MMMNDFGVPMSDAEMSMQAPGAIKPHEQIMATSGTEMQWGWAAASFGLALVSGISSRNQAKKARNAEEEFLQRKYEEYDLPMWEMNKDKLVAQRDEIIRSIELAQRNEKKRAEFQDKNNLRNYQHSLKIREMKYENDVMLKRRSDFFTNKAIESGIAQQQQEEFQTHQQYAFENEENIVAGIIAKGEAAVKSQSGRSAVKAMQSMIADEGRQMAIMTENIINARKDGRARLNDFLIQQEAGRMLEPSRGIAPLKPLETPISEYELPRALEEFDFGPQPIPGVAQTQVPSMLGTIAGAAAKGATVMANNYSGTDTGGYGGNSYGGHSMQDYYSGGGQNTWGTFTESTSDMW
tara:strand:- start:1572 stop:2624 length:1053 start_codon:yes stop_codon:yes gene_type:complete